MLQMVLVYANLCMVLSLPQNLTITPSPWSPCQPTEATNYHPNGLESIQTRNLTVCDRELHCQPINGTLDNQDIFRLYRPCEMDDDPPIVAIVFVTLLLAIITIGCMWACGCFRRKNRGIHAVPV